MSQSVVLTLEQTDRCHTQNCGGGGTAERPANNKKEEEEVDVMGVPSWVATADPVHSILGRDWRDHPLDV